MNTRDPRSNGSVDQPTGTRRVRRTALTIALAGGLALGGGAAAFAAGSPSPSSSSSSSAAPSTKDAPSPPSAKGSAKPPAPKPHIDGEVTAVDDTSITVKDPEGFTRTIVISDSTTYGQAPKAPEANGSGSAGTDAGSSADVTVGVLVHATGAVDENGTSLDATSIEIGRPPAPPRGPAGGPPAPPAGAPAPSGEADSASTGSDTGPSSESSAPVGS